MTDRTLRDFNEDGHLRNCSAWTLASQTDEVPMCDCAGLLREVASALLAHAPRNLSGLVEECDRFGAHRRGAQHHHALTTAPYVPEHLPAVVRSYRYKPGWLFYLDYDREPDGAGGLTLWIMSDTDNSLAPGRINVHHPFLVPPASYRPEVWEVWIKDRLGDVEMHERNEFIQINGERRFAPHHGNGEDPYITWHHGTEEARAKRSGED